MPGSSRATQRAKIITSLQHQGVRGVRVRVRHSYASYRLAAVLDAPKIALEMGSSREKLFRQYRELVTPDAAKEWFAIMPPAKINVTRGA